MIKTISSDNWKNDSYNYPAGFLLRFIAYVIDLVVFFPVFLIFFAIDYFFNITLPENSLEILFLVYIIIYHWKQGATIGKKETEIRVENENGEQISLKQSMIRIIFPLISLLITIIFSIYHASQTSTMIVVSNDIFKSLIIEFYIHIFTLGIIVIDILWMFTNKEKRTLHDLIAKTRCKKKL